MSADIYTKAFTEPDKWDHALKLINLLDGKNLEQRIRNFDDDLEKSAKRFAKPPKEEANPDAGPASPDDVLVFQAKEWRNDVPET